MDINYNHTNPNHNEDPMIGKLIFDRFKLIKKLGSGSFGSIYSAEFENQYFAIKLEEKNRGQNLLENEAYIMSYLNGPGLPYVKSFGYSNKHNILVMELMGKSLEDIFESFVVKTMTTRCVCNIGYQMIEILEYIHNKHVIHRDIKPDNFVVGLNEKRKYIYILDFGLSKKYRSSRTLQHYEMVKNKNLTGTARYASINALNGLTQSRRDDLEAIGYVLMYFLRGRLPWQGIPVKNKEDRYRKIMEKKKATSAEELCQGFPKEFADYINYTRNLEYEEDPDYIYLRNLFINILNRDGFKIDCYYDWDKETIHYFRDFKNGDMNKSSTNIKNQIDSNSSRNNPAISNGNINMHSSHKEKPFIRISNKNNNKYNTKYSSKYNTSITNYQISNKNGVTTSGTINENSNSLLKRKKQPESLYANKTVKEYIRSQQQSYIENSQNKIENINKNNSNINNNVKNNNNSNINNNDKNINNSNNLLNIEKNEVQNQKDIKIEQEQNINKHNNNNINENIETGDNIEHKKPMNPRSEKDNKCCIIF